VVHQETHPTVGAPHLMLAVTRKTPVIEYSTTGAVFLWATISG